jgi:hypothetical protein
MLLIGTQIRMRSYDTKMWHNNIMNIHGLQMLYIYIIHNNNKQWFNLVMYYSLHEFEIANSWIGSMNKDGIMRPVGLLLSKENIP